MSHRFPILISVILSQLGVLADAEEQPLDAYLQKVLEYNDQLQVQLMDYEISRQMVEGAKAAFEPEFVLRSQYDDVSRPNNAEELRNLGGLQFFKQRSMLYSAAVEALTASGARTRVGLDVRHLNNNLQPFRAVNQEWSSFLGMSFVQPLLKGKGSDVTLAAVRVAALESDQAYQEFRRQMMVILVGAEVAYWNLYYAQEQLRFYQESLVTVKALASDVETRFEVGKGSELDALNAKVAVRSREGSVAVAEQGLQETLNMALSFVGEGLSGMNAKAPPSNIQTDYDVNASFEKAQRFNPEYIGRQRQIAIESLRLQVAENQNKPSLDFLGSFGVTGLSENFTSSLSEMGNATHPTWSVGLEFRMPLGGGKKGKSDLRTADLRRKQAIRQLSVLRSQMRGAVENALFKVRAARKNGVSLSETTGLNEKLLQTELERLKAGKSSADKILEAEQSLFEARVTELENLVNTQRALLELDVVMGVVLDKRGIEWTKDQLAVKTAALFDDQNFEETDVDAYRQSLDPIIQQNP